MHSVSQYPIVIFIAAILLLLVGIIRWKINPFLVLTVVGLLTGLAGGLPLPGITKLLTDGFGNTMGKIGLLVGLGIILGNILSQSGATLQIARLFIRIFGTKYIYLAIGITGYVVCIPVFFQAAFIMFLPLLRDLSKQAKVPFVGLLTALVLGCLATHCVVIPTPGPLAVMSNMSLSTGNFLGWGLVVALPPTLLGVLAARYFAGQAFMQVAIPDSAYTPQTEKQLPSGGMSLLVLLLPILLIFIGNVLQELLPIGDKIGEIFGLLGNTNVAMLLGLGFAVYALKKYCSSTFDDIVTSSGAEAGLLILIVGAGGAFGEILIGTGIAEHIVGTLKAYNMPLIWMGFLITAVIRMAIGSATVAAITVSKMLAPMLAQSADNPIMVGLAICCGSICFSFPNDSGFWVICKFSGLSVTQNLRVLTLMSGIIGICGFVTALIVNWLV
jgi:gluconate:H+ symporter, GntP family